MYSPQGCIPSKLLQNNDICTDYYQSHKLVIFAVSSSALLFVFYLLQRSFFSIATGVNCYHQWSRFPLLQASLFVSTSIFLGSGHSCSSWSTVLLFATKIITLWLSRNHSFFWLALAPRVQDIMYLKAFWKLFWVFKKATMRPTRTPEV